jgi:hypothetical protein
MSRPSRSLWAFALIAGAIGACQQRPSASPGMKDRSPSEVRSNLLRSDYAGSDTCQGCHAAEYRAWFGSPMHRMT